MATAAYAEEGSALRAGIASVDGIEEEISRAGRRERFARLLSKLLTE